jgi:hypothetical protein
MSMKQEQIEESVVSESTRLKVEPRPIYGSVPGLDDEELASPAELERWAMVRQWGPILDLPVRGHRGGIRPEVEESGLISWGAFGTIDFERTMPEFDKAAYKADKLREELRDVVIRLGIVGERTRVKGRGLVLKYLRLGLLDLDDIGDPDMRAMGRLYLRARRLRREVRELEEVSEMRRKRKVERWLAQFGD